MINPIGSAVAENIGLNPFMKKICQYFLKEDLILPQIATWWCGQKKELDFVLENFDKLIIKKIDIPNNIKVYFGRKLSKDEKKNLINHLIQNPHQYVAQEEIEFSTVPYYTEGKIEPRNAVIRTFCLKKDEDYSVMNGGLVRISENKENRAERRDERKEKRAERRSKRQERREKRKAKREARKEKRQE